MDYETERAVRYGVYVFGHLTGIPAIVELAKSDQDAQDIAQDMMGWFWDLDGEIDEPEPEFDEETLDGIAAFRKFMNSVAYPQDDPYYGGQYDADLFERTELYESSDQMPWNRDGTQDAIDDWNSHQGQMSDAEIQSLAEAEAEREDAEAAIEEEINYRFAQEQTKDDAPSVTDWSNVMWHARERGDYNG